MTSPNYGGGEQALEIARGNRDAFNALLAAEDPADVIMDILDTLGYSETLDSSPGVEDTGIPDLRTHARLVINTFRTYFSDADLPAEVDLALMYAILGLHDIAKPSAHAQGQKSLHKEQSAAMIRPAMADLGFPPEEANLAVALVESDGLGRLAGAAAHGASRTYLDPRIQHVAKSLAAYADPLMLDRASFFQLRVVYFMCDSFSYTATMNPYRPAQVQFTRQFASTYDVPATEASGRLILNPDVVAAFEQVAASMEGI